MQNSKLIQLMRVLQKKEIIRLRKFLRSPLYNRREELSQLFEHLLHLLKKKRIRLEKQAIFSHIYPDTSYSDAQLHLLFSGLLQLLERFIMIDQYLHEQAEGQIRLLQWYRQRGLEQHFKQVYQKLEQQLDQQEFRDIEYLEFRNRIIWEAYQWDVVSKPSGELPLEQMTQLTDIVYFSQKLRQLSLMKSQQAIYKQDYNIQHQAFIFDSLKHYKLSDYPALEIYVLVNQLLDGVFDRQGFLSFINKLITSAAYFKELEIRELYFIAINWCIKQVNNGTYDYFEEMLYLYKTGFSKGFLLENGKISRFAYYNVVAAALYSKDFEWGESFIHTFKDKLEEPYRESAYNHNLALFEYKQGHYDHAQRLLQNANYQDVLFNLSAKTLLLKIYYETAEFDLLEAHLDAMKNFIRRKKVIGYHQNNYFNLIKFTQKLIRVNWFDKTAVEQLRQEINDVEILTERPWVLEQLINIKSF